MADLPDEPTSPLPLNQIGGDDVPPAVKGGLPDTRWTFDPVSRAVIGVAVGVGILLGVGGCLYLLIGSVCGPARR